MKTGKTKLKNIKDRGIIRLMGNFKHFEDRLITVIELSALMAIIIGGFVVTVIMSANMKYLFAVPSSIIYIAYAFTDFLDEDSGGEFFVGILELSVVPLVSCILHYILSC